MKLIHKTRLLKVVQALRDAELNEALKSKFSMEVYGVEWSAVNTCGTPCCALGHYAARTDLQNEFILHQGTVDAKDGRMTNMAYAGHFGLSRTEFGELFGASGCGEAQTPREAADYFVSFITEKESLEGLELS